MAGRPKGSYGRDKRQLLMRLQELYPDYHPVIEMAKTANNEELDPSLRFNANREVAKYVTPALKAVEVTGEDSGPIKIAIGWDAD